MKKSTKKALKLVAGVAVLAGVGYCAYRALKGSPVISVEDMGTMAEEAGMLLGDAAEVATETTAELLK